MKPVGYLTNTRFALEGNPGQFYDYVLAGNGLFVKAQNSHLSAALCIATAQIRGLAPLKEHIELVHGKIPSRLYELAISILAAASPKERYLAITWEEAEYRLRQPEQAGSTGRVEYSVLPDTVFDIHSHGTMKAFFSYTDDRDEQGLRLYMVVGRLDSLFPEVLIRVGVYGYFVPVQLKDVFDLW